MLEDSPFLDPFTDFGFKKIFGEEANKELLISFLNTLLPAHHQIEDLEYSKNEHLANLGERKAIFDVHCRSSSGERFIVELQRAKQKNFVERALYYASFPIQEQAKKSEWDFSLKAVYCVGILAFSFDDMPVEEKDWVIHHHQIKNQRNRVVTDKLTFIYLTLNNFKKTEEQSVSFQEKWFYILKNLSKIKNIPASFTEHVFQHLFKIAEVGKLNPVERSAYEASLKTLRDNHNIQVTAYEEAFGDGRRIQALETAKTMKALNLPLETIIAVTGFTKGELESL
jgi:predicted transposase/invertase (TIGR01784 family)